ncbi:fibronectin type III domain-containing protein [Candidatus Chlorohelix sp.]|uniref:fibronectin type III domain-containing protein n=1 Tax=Candidatus Chlorohelix sp. TaxID=3139201 RepID=UPI00302E059D
MTPRAMCRVILAAMMLLVPLLSECFSPAQVWGAGWQANFAPASTTPSGTSSGPILNSSNGGCDFDPNNPQNGGIFGNANLGGGAQVDGVQVDLLNAITGQVILTTTTQLPTGYVFPIFYFGSSIPFPLNYKVRFNSNGYNNRGVVYYPNSPTFEGADTLSFVDQATCQMIDLDTGTTLPLLGSGVSQTLYTPGSVVGRLLVRNSGNPITTGVPISSAAVILVKGLVTQTNVPDITSGIVTTSNTDAHGNFIIDRNSIASVANGTSLFIKFSLQNYTTNWYGSYTPPVDSVTDANPTTFSPLELSSLVSVILTSTIDYSETYYPPGAQSSGSIILGQMTADRHIQGTVYQPNGTTPTTGGRVEAWANGNLASTADIAANGTYDIGKLAPYVGYKLKFYPPTGAPYVSTWYHDPAPTLTYARNITNATPITPTVGTLTITGKDGEFIKGGNLTGTIALESGGPTTSNIIVEVFDGSVPITQAAVLTSTVVNITTGSNTYTIPGILENSTYNNPGASYRVRFRSTDYPTPFIQGWYATAGGLVVADPTLAVAQSFTTEPPTDVPLDFSVTIPRGNIIQGTISPSSGAFDGSPTLTVYNGTIAVQTIQVTGAGPSYSYFTSPLPNGSYTVHVTPPPPIVGHSGYRSGYFGQSGSGNWVATAAQATAITILGTSVNSVNIVMPLGVGLDVVVRTPDITGTSYTAYGAVEVRVLDTSQAQPYPIIASAQTGFTDGIASFRSLAAGTYGLLVLPPGNGAPKFIPNITLTSGIITETVTVERAAFITGVLSNSDTSPYDFGTVASPNITIQAYNTNNNLAEITLQLTSLIHNSDNSYTYIAKLVGGSYKLKFTPTSTYLPQWYHLKYNRDTGGADLLTVSPDLSYNNISATFFPGGAFRALVVDADNNDAPLSGVTMNVYSTNTPTSTPIDFGGDNKSNSEGYVTHKPQTAGSYYLGFSYPNKQTIFYSNKITITDATSQPITAGQYTALTVKMSSPLTITGIITFPTPVLAGGQVLVKAWRADTSEYVGMVVVPINTSTTQLNYSLTVPAAQYKIEFDYYSVSSNSSPTQIGYYSQVTSFLNADPIPAVTPTTPSSISGIDHIFTTVPCAIDGYTPGTSTTTSVNINFHTTCVDTSSHVTWSTVPGSVGTTFAGPSGVLDHNVTITGLLPNTTYYLKPYSTPLGGGSEVSYSSEIVARTSADGKAWYFAAGNTENSAANKTDEVLHILNTHSISTTTGLISVYGTNGLLGTQSFTVTPTTAITVSVNGISGVAAGTEHSTVVTVTSGSPDVLVERSLYTNRSLLTGATTNGGYTIAGVTAPSNTWYFPEANKTSEQYFTIFNPNVITGCFSIRYYNDGTGGIGRTISGKTIPPNSRLRFSTQDLTYGASVAVTSLFGVVIASSSASGCMQVPLVVEQELYSYTITNNGARKGVSGIFGLSAPQTSWNFADGMNGAMDYETYSFLNTTNNPVVITLTNQLESAPGILSSPVITTIPAGAHLAVRITNPNSNQPGRNYGFSVQIQASAKIVVGRYATYMILPLQGWDGIIAEQGNSRTATRWLFAGGDTLQNPGTKMSSLTYVIANNNSSQVANVTLKYYDSSGSITSKTLTVGANQRVSVNAASISGSQAGFGAGKSIVAVQVESNISVSAERIFYWNYNGWVGGNISFGYIPPGF